MTSIMIPYSGASPGPLSSGGAERQHAIQQFMSRHGEFAFTSGHFYKGPRNARALSKVSFIEFPSEESRNQFIGKVGESGNVGAKRSNLRRLYQKLMQVETMLFVKRRN